MVLISFSEVKKYPFSLYFVVLGISPTNNMSLPVVEYQELFAISTKFILDILLPCFAFPGFEVPGNMFWGGGMHFGTCAILLVKEQISSIRHLQVQKRVVN